MGKEGHRNGGTKVLKRRGNGREGLEWGREGMGMEEGRWVIIGMGFKGKRRNGKVLEWMGREGERWVSIGMDLK